MRLLGVDAPELDHDGADHECGAQDAARRLDRTLKAGTAVRVVYDTRSDATDTYDRSLAYIEHVNRDGKTVDIGRDLVASGFIAAWYPKGEVEQARFSSYQRLQGEAQDRGNWPNGDDLGR